MEIRNVKLDDIEQIANIQVKGWQNTYKNIIDSKYLDTMDTRERIKKLEDSYKEGAFIVLEDRNEILGFCRFTEDNIFSKEYNAFDCELCAIYVRTDQIRNKIGSKMFKYVVRHLKAIGKTNMILWCLKENYNARKFYEKMGGNIIGEKYVEIGDRVYSEVGFSYYIKDINI